MAEELSWVYDIYTAWNDGDVERFAEYFATDADYVTSGLFPGIEPVYTGPDGMRRFHADMLSAWERFRVEPGEFREAGGGVVLIPVRFHGRGRSSGVDVALDFHHVATAGDHKVGFLAAGPNLDAALELAAEHGVTPGRVP